MRRLEGVDIFLAKFILFFSFGVLILVLVNMDDPMDGGDDV